MVPPPVPQPIVEEPIVEEPEPEPEPIEEEEREPEDNRAPLFIRTTISHGDADIDIDTDRFVFTFDENIGDAKVKLRNDTRNFDMNWETFIVGKEITLLRLFGRKAPAGSGGLHNRDLMGGQSRELGSGWYYHICNSVFIERVIRSIR